MKTLIEKLKALRLYFVSSRFMINVGKKGYGHSYSWKDRHLFFDRNKKLTANGSAIECEKHSWVKMANGRWCEKCNKWSEHYR